MFAHVNSQIRYLDRCINCGIPESGHPANGVQYRRAHDLLAEALGPDHPHTLQSLGGMWTAFFVLRDPEQAWDGLVTLLPRLVRVRGPADEQTLAARLILVGSTTLAGTVRPRSPNWSRSPLGPRRRGSRRPRRLWSTGAANSDEPTSRDGPTASCVRGRTGRPRGGF